MSNAIPVVATESLPGVKLRGYGTVSGEAMTVAAPSGKASILRIHCDDEASAKLLCAKYLSDVSVLPGVSNLEVPISSGKIAAKKVEGQGSLAAGRVGKEVYIVAAGNDADLAWTIGKTSGLDKAVWEPETQVPMYLDRWDRFGFRHYYYNWQLPKGEKTSTYDFSAEFDWAKAQDRAGILLPIFPLNNDHADGMLNTGWGGWVGEEARRRGLPVDIHLTGAHAGGEPTWLLNRFREQTQLKMPGFTGNFYSIMSPYLGGAGVMSWIATTGKDAQLALVQEVVRRSVGEPNVVSFLEPHGETYHGPQDIFLEYGPVADAAYRRYLQETYTTPAAVAARWGMPVQTWEDVHVPEIATFAGWGPQALDLGGTWKVGYEEVIGEAKTYEGNWNEAAKTKPAPDAWFAADFADADWPGLVASGHDRQLFLVKRPAVFRRSFDVPSAWRAGKQRIWLYLWDMNMATNQEVRVVLNGNEISRGKIAHNTPHWCALEVTAALKDGANTLAIRLPQGYLAYKTYLSPVEPRQYPGFGAGLNAQWVDFCDFTAWSRAQAIRRGMEAIRQAAPDHPITMMHPDECSDGLISLAKSYGGEFHNTGYMGAFYADYNSSLMRGADLPYSLEPSRPAHDFTEWRRGWGLWQVEGVQSVDYFIHLGDILWNPQIKADYEAHRKQFTLMGQSHFAKAEVACLYSDRTARLTGYPWGAAPNTGLPGGYWAWNAGAVLRGRFPYDGLSQSSFANGDADPYRVIVDSNTSIMDETQVAELERWIKAGGTFITLAQTGRHTPEKPDAWPIARLTGYRVTHIDRLKPDGGIDEQGILQAAPGQKVYDQSWNGVAANGLHLERVAGDVQNLLLWKSGGVAVGSRRLGKGVIVQLGAKFTGAKIYDRVEPGGDNAESKRLRDLLTAVLDWRGIAREAGQLVQDSDWVWLRPAVTNNGLYDTWTVFNWSKDQNQVVSINLGKVPKPAFAIEARDGKRIAVKSTSDGAVIGDIALEPSETRVFLTPRGQLAQAPSAWFGLQRNWWRGTTQPPAKPLAVEPWRYARELTADWKVKFLDDKADATPLLALAVDDTAWPTRALGIWDTKEAGNTGHAVFRKRFTVPAEWKAGRVALWMTSWFNTSFVDSGRVWLDGREVKAMNNGAYIAENPSGFQAGSTHTLAVEVTSKGVLAGLRGQCWLSLEPTPAQRLDLAGTWSPSIDGLRYDKPIPLPGAFKAQFLRRTVTIDAAQRGKTVALTVEGDRSLIGVLINGRLARRHHCLIGERWTLNLTPFVRFGAENDIELVRWDGAGKGAVREVALNFFDPTVYP